MASIEGHFNDNPVNWPGSRLRTIEVNFSSSVRSRPRVKRKTYFPEDVKILRWPRRLGVPHGCDTMLAKPFEIKGLHQKMSYPSFPVGCTNLFNMLHGKIGLALQVDVTPICQQRDLRGLAS